MIESIELNEDELEEESMDDAEQENDELALRLHWWHKSREHPKQVIPTITKMVPAIIKPTEVELKLLPEHINYGCLGEQNTLPQLDGLSPTLRESIPYHVNTKIRLEEGKKLVVDAQCHLNPAMKVVEKELLNWLDVDIIYTISDSEWVRSTQCVPNKGGLIVVENDKNELIPMRTFIEWRMLDRLVGKEYYFFIDGYSRYHQILIHPND
ncbi:Transposon Ty3-I Gag-Pol polyprotein [Gossypium australe]|uniref:Transposon Ty3-I Gag-Pol polyprotein n=1 Tax=Gossypium australe TaxID=47621 RepID=A0A5B6V8Z2_9ROSI|nr:Transposon Ty3-I Gag-Pol polyprotein [Gossypium australe]